MSKENLNQATEADERKFKKWQWRTIFGTMIGYAIFYFVRKNFSFAIPGLTAEYGISNTTFGAIMTLVGLVYGLSKFGNGILADRMNGRKHMMIGLSACVVVNILFGASAIICAWFAGCNYGPKFIGWLVPVFAVLLILNNLFQGSGNPPCNRLLTHWIPPHELATKMSVWNTSHSIGAGLLAVLCGYIMGNMGSDMTGDAEMVKRVTENVSGAIDASQLDAYVHHALQHVGAWQWVFWIPSLIAIGGVIFIYIVLRDTPSSVGLRELPGTGEKKAAGKDDSAEFKAFLRRRVFLNPVIWSMATCSFFVYIVRFAVLDWGPTFLRTRGMSSELTGWSVAIFELFGCAGMLLAGWLSDTLFKGRAVRTCVFCMLGTTIAVAVFVMLPPETSHITSLLVLAVAGFFLYGPQALLGIAAANHATRRAAATAIGLVGFVSYVSVVVSGWAFGYISEHWGWNTVLYIMLAMSLVGCLLLLSLWKLPSNGYGEDDETA